MKTRTNPNSVQTGKQVELKIDGHENVEGRVHAVKRGFKSNEVLQFTVRDKTDTEYRVQVGAGNRIRVFHSGRTDRMVGHLNAIYLL